MAVRAIDLDDVSTRQDQCHVATWTGILNGDSGEPVAMPGSADRSAQVTGTFGAGGSLRIEGSNDGTNYYALNDPQGSALNITAAGIKGIIEATRFIRPRATAGDGTTSLTVTMLLRRNTR